MFKKKEKCDPEKEQVVSSPEADTPEKSDAAPEISAEEKLKACGRHISFR